MFGFLIGTACLVGLCAVARGGCHHRWRRGWRGGWSHGGPPWREGGRRMALYWLSDRLQATPGQERAIAAALERVLAAKEKARGDLAKVGAALARELRSPQLDRDALQREVSQAHGELVHVEEAVLDAASEIHEALEPEQRRRLAELLDQVTGARPWSCGCGHDRERAA